MPQPWILNAAKSPLIKIEFQVRQPLPRAEGEIISVVKVFYAFIESFSNESNASPIVFSFFRLFFTQADDPQQFRP